MPMLTKDQVINTTELLRITLQLSIDDYKTFDNDRKAAISKLVKSLFESDPAGEYELLTPAFLSTKSRRTTCDAGADVIDDHFDAWFGKSIQGKSDSTELSLHPQMQLDWSFNQVPIIKNCIFREPDKFVF
jgi:hypothetical protein